MLQIIKGIAIFLSVFICVGNLLAQINIKYVEYYIDTDPGYGKGTKINETVGANLDNNTVNINTNSLTAGVHLFGIRAKDGNGAWSLDNTWLFVKPMSVANITNIVAAEYYIDSDPGYGNAIPINITSGINLSNIIQNVETDTLAAGVHILGIRAKDGNEAWSLDNKWLFVKQAQQSFAANLIRVEYYIDVDPGYGKASVTKISSATDLSNITQSINIDNLSVGAHLFGIRALDANGAWSLDNKWLFVKDTSLASIPNIVRVEYYIDNDPGYGKAASYPFVPTTNIMDSLLELNVSELPEGAHVLVMRAQDATGAWSLDNRLPFVTTTNVPIVLSNFYGQHINNENELTAQIAQAINVKEIQMERSGDGNNFNYLGILASGNVNAGTYKFDDSSPLAGKNFYRLRTVDLDGKVTYSIVIFLTNTSGFAIQAYPNPVNDNLTLHFQNAQKGIYNVAVTDVSGKLFFTNKINISQSGETGDMSIPVKNYAAGTYFVRIIDASGTIVSVQKIIKN